MARKKATPTPTESPATPAAPTMWDERVMLAILQHWVELVGGLTFLFGAVTLLGLAGATAAGPLDGWVSVLRQLFGWGAFALFGVALVAGLHLMTRRAKWTWRLRPMQVIGLELMILTVLPLGHQLSGATFDEAWLGQSVGGLFGWALAVPLLDYLGPLLTVTIFLGLFLCGLAWLTRFKLTSLVRVLVYTSGRLRRWADQIDVDPDEWDALEAARATRSAGSERVFDRLPAPPSSATPAQQAAVVSVGPALPSLRLLTRGVQEQVGSAEIKAKTTVIEQTLRDFGLAGSVVEVRRGPSITQFGIEPGYLERPAPDGKIHHQKVRISQIANLRADFALALEVHRLRVEAPVPGRGTVGIEVPNRNPAVVRLRDVLESAAFRRLEAPLAVGLGRNVSGEPIAVDLSKMPHLLIAGTTGSGKSICIKSLIASLVMNNTPDELSLVMIDPKRVEMMSFAGFPHLLGPVEVEAERVIGVLRWVVAEMERRYEVFAECRARNLRSYNDIALGDVTRQPMPRLVVFIDELADLMAQFSSEVERHLCRLAQMARATGIHLVVATQRPSTDVITGLIKANFPARIAFSVASSIDSRVILDTNGAENLLGQGDMLFLSPEASVPARIQGCFVEESEIMRVAEYWQQVAPAASDAEPPWETLLAKMHVIEQTDDMLEKAIALCQKYDTVSTSLLQRRLRVGFPRAARIMESLYEMGLVEDPKDGGKTRRSYVSPEDDPLADFIESQD